MLSRLFLSGFWKRTRSGAGWLLRHAIILAPALFVVELLLQAVAPSYRNQVFDHEYTGGYPIEMNAEGLLSAR